MNGGMGARLRGPQLINPVIQPSKQVWRYGKTFVATVISRAGETRQRKSRLPYRGVTYWPVLAYDAGMKWQVMVTAL